MGLITKAIERVEKEEGAQLQSEVAPASKRKKRLAVLLATCLVAGAFIGSGYLFFLRSESETPPRTPAQSLKAKRKPLQPSKHDSRGRESLKAEKTAGVVPERRGGLPGVGETAAGAAVPKPKLAQKLVKAEGLPTSPGGYTIQLWASRERKVAQNLASRMISRGYKAYVQEADLSGTGLVYRVRIGAYPSPKEALAAKEEIASRYATEGWIDNYIPPGEEKGMISKVEPGEKLALVEAARHSEPSTTSATTTAIPIDEPSTLVSKGVDLHRQDGGKREATTNEGKSESPATTESSQLSNVVAEDQAEVALSLRSATLDSLRPGESLTVATQSPSAAGRGEVETSRAEPQSSPASAPFREPREPRQKTIEIGATGSQQRSPQKEVPDSSTFLGAENDRSEPRLQSYATNTKEELAQGAFGFPERSDSRARRYYSKGVSYQTQEKLEEAIQSYRKALSFDPDHQQARLNLATAYMQLGRLKEAEQELTSLYSSEPQDSKVLFNLGLLLYQFGEYTSAEAKLREVTELDPFHLEANLLLASIYEQWGEQIKALEYCMNAYRINSTDPRVLYRLGRVWDVAGEPAEAVKYYRLYLKTDSDGASGLKLAVRDRLNYLVSQQGGER